MFHLETVNRPSFGSTLVAVIAAALATATCLTAAIGPAYAASPAPIVHTIAA